MNKKMRIFLIAIFMVACKNNEISAPVFAVPETPVNKVTYQEAQQLASDRLKSFSNDLSLTIQTNNSVFENHAIDLVVTIENVSKHELVIKKPRSTGIASTYFLKSASNDVEIFLTSTDGELLENIFPTSQFEFDARMRDIIQAYAWHQQKDFIVLQPEDIYRYQFFVDKVYVDSENSSSYQTLPDGDYLVYAVYENTYIGYHEIEEEEIENFDFVGNKDSLIYDLNAWVGQLVSEKIPLKIK